MSDGHGKKEIEMPIYFGDSRKWVKGIDERTTVEDVISAILIESMLSNEPSAYILYDKYNGITRRIPPETKILSYWMAKNMHSTFILTPDESKQQLYANVGTGETHTYRRENLTNAIKKQALKLNEQVTHIAKLDSEINEMSNFFDKNSKDEPSEYKINKFMPLSKYDILKCFSNVQNESEMKSLAAYAENFSIILEKIRRKTWELWTSEIELSRLESDAENSGSLCVLKTLNQMANRAEQQSLKLKCEFDSLMAAQSEIEKLTLLKNQHYEEIKALAQDCLQDADMIRNSSDNFKSRDSFGFENLPNMKRGSIRRLSSNSNKILQSTKPSNTITDKVENNDDLVLLHEWQKTLHDEDSDTGVSSMNSDDLAILETLV